MEVAAARLLDHVLRLPTAAAERGAPAADLALASSTRSARAELGTLERTSLLRSKSSDQSLALGVDGSTTETSSEGQYHDTAEDSIAEPRPPSLDDHAALARALGEAEAHLEELRGELRDVHEERRRMLRDAVALISEIIGTRTHE